MTVKAGYKAFVLIGLLCGACAAPFPGFNAAQFLALIGDGSGSSAEAMPIQIIESGNSSTVTENGAGDSYYIVLGRPPTSTVAIAVTPPAGLTVNGSAVAFNANFDATCPGASCWSVQQTMSILATNDSIASGSRVLQIGHSVTTADSYFSGQSPRTIDVSVTDDDSAGISLTESGGSTSVSEVGGTDSYTVVLTSEPTSPVTITVNASAQVQVNGAASAVLTFNNTCPGANCWSTAQTVTVSAVNDALMEGAHTGSITHSVASADSNYGGFALASVTASIADDDTAGITMTESGGSTSISEAGVSDDYTVVLTSEPTATVTITVTADAQTQVNGGNTATLTFDATCPGANCWSDAQPVTVAAINDSIAEGAHFGTITHSVSSTDSNYSSLTPGSLSASIADNDTAAIAIVQSGGTTTVSEAGATDSYTLVLTSEPTGNVVISVVGGEQLTVAGGSLSSYTFTPANWNLAQTVNVAAVNDTYAENSPHNALLLHGVSSTDSNYNNYVLSNVDVQITDDDSGVILTETLGTTIVNEAATTDTYSLVLTGLPLVNVDVTVTPDSQVRVNGSVAPIVITFTALNWFTPQVITVSGINDGLTEGVHNGLISHTVSSLDGNFGGKPVPIVHARINEAAPACPAYHPDCAGTVALWVKADRGTVTSSGKVSRLHDVTQNLFFGLFQPTIARQPTYTDNALNGKPVLTFGGSHSINRTDNVVSLGDFTLCTVYRATGTGFVYEHGDASDSAGGGSFLYPGTSPNLFVRRTTSTTGRDLSPGPLAADGTWKILCQTYGGTHASHTMHIDGTLESTTASGSMDPGSAILTRGFYLGSRGDASMFNLNGSIAEVVVYASALLDADRETVECYLKNKYALSLSHGCP